MVPLTAATHQGRAVAIRALEIVRDEGLVERAERLGSIFRKGLSDLHSPMITTIRGKGLLNAIIIDESKTNNHSAWDLCMLMKEKGLLVGRALKVAHIKGQLAKSVVMIMIEKNNLLTFLVTIRRNRHIRTSYA